MYYNKKYICIFLRLSKRQTLAVVDADYLADINTKQFFNICMKNQSIIYTDI